MAAAVAAADSLRRLQLQRRIATTRRRRRRGVLGRGLREAESHRKCWLLNSGGGRGAAAGFLHADSLCSTVMVAWARIQVDTGFW